MTDSLLSFKRRSFAVCSRKPILTLCCSLLIVTLLCYLHQLAFARHLLLFQEKSYLRDVQNGIGNSSSTPAGIPMLLHFVYKEERILQAYRASLANCIRQNPNWIVVLWTDASARRFVIREFPQHLRVFDAFKHKLQRSDAIRYLILYRFGGVYLDLDMNCRQPILKSLSSVACFLDKEREHQTQVVHWQQYSAMNSAMGCTPGHPFFAKLISYVLHPDRLVGQFKDSLLLTTGPLVLTKIYKEWAQSKSEPGVTLLNETYFSPRIAPKICSICRGILKAMGPNAVKPSMQQAACMNLRDLGFEKSDALFVTNLTVAIHEFTHLGYADQARAPMFDAINEFPQINMFY